MHDCKICKICFYCPLPRLRLGCLGCSLAFCSDLIKASTHTRQIDKSLQKNAYFAYCFAYCSILFGIFSIFFILQYAKYAECERCTILLHIVHIVLHTAAYYLPYSAYIAYCSMQNMQNMNPALFFGMLCIFFAYICINVQNTMQTQKSICRKVQGSYFACW